MTTSPSPLPPLYDRWMRTSLSGAVPNEPKATCHDCAMCAEAGQVADPKNPVFYDPSTKCCTYMPVLWNFLAGALLEDDSPEAAAGRVTVEARIAAGVAVTPLGMERPPVYNALYSHISDAFGRSRSMRCPHYIEEGGLCGVWRHRESTCATWFCKHERGEVGKKFWTRLHRLLLLVERQLASWCVLQLGVGDEALAANFPFPLRRETPISPADFDDRVTPEQRTMVWGTWTGREHEFYRAAHRLVRDLAWSDVLAIGGPDLRVAETLAQSAYRGLVTARLPERLQRGSFQLSAATDGAVLATTYSPIDPLRLSAEILAILPYFDGRPHRAARQAIARELGHRVDPGLLQKLVDFGILVDATT